MRVLALVYDSQRFRSLSIERDRAYTFKTTITVEVIVTDLHGRI